MKKIQGIRNDKGYTTIRIWLGPKKKIDGSFNRPYRKSFGPWAEDNIQRAKNHLEKVRLDFKNGIQPAPDPVPLSVVQACDIFYKYHWVEKRNRTPEGISNVGYKLPFFKKYWPAQAWHTMSPQKVEAYMGWRKGRLDIHGQKLAKPCNGVADSTVNNELNLLSSMFNVIKSLVARRDIPAYLLPTTSPTNEIYNPVMEVERDTIVVESRKRVASDEELRKVKQYCDAKDPEMLEMIKRTIISGLRKTNARKANGLANVSGVLSKTKGKKRFQLPLDFSKKLNYTNFPRRWVNLKKACDMLIGEKRFVWHDWRHTTGTMLSTLGFTIKQIQEFFGQSNEKMAQIYVNHGVERLQPHVDGIEGKLDEVWKDVPAPPVVDPGVKACKGCKKTLPLASFGHHSAFKSGLNSRCKVCCYQATVQQRQRNPLLRAKEYAKYVDKRRSPSSAVEHSLHMGGVGGSNPPETTISKDRPSVGNEGVNANV